MNSINKNLELPQDKNGKYILTADAVKAIKKATTFVARHNPNNPNETFFRAIVEKYVEGEKIEIYYDMPINVTDRRYGNADMYFCCNVTTGSSGIHPLSELVRPNVVLEFEPFMGAWTTGLQEELQITTDVLFYRVHLTDKKMVRDHFAHQTGKPDSNGKRYFMQKVNLVKLLN